MVASVWLELGFPQGGWLLCLSRHLVTQAEGLIITDTHAFLIRVSVVPFQLGKKVEMLLSWTLKHTIHLGTGNNVINYPLFLFITLPLSISFSSKFQEFIIPIFPSVLIFSVNSFR